MEFRKTLIYLLSFSISLISTNCESTNKIPSLKKQYKEIYVEQFKLTYIRSLLKKSYNNSVGVQELIKNDHSGFSEPILIEDDFKLIDSLTNLDNYQLITDSSKGKFRAEGTQGKRPLGFFINKLESKWLDSLAKNRLKINGIPDSWKKR